MSWKVGKVKITKVNEIAVEGGTRFMLPQATYNEIQQLPWLIPDFATESGKLKMSIHSLIVETPTRRIIVDTCIGNDKENRGVPTWNKLNKPFLEDMTKAGYPPESIDTVFCTHLHVDHVGWNTKLVNGKWVPTFENARYIFVKPEYEYWRDNAPTPSHAAVFEDSVKPIMDANKAELVAPDREDLRRADADLDAGSQPRPRQRPHQVGRRGRPSDRRRGAPSLPDVAHGMVVDRRIRSRAVQQTKRELFSRFADTKTLVIGGHFDAGTIKRDGDRFKYFAA